jgi:hypothetical protein
MPVRFSSSVVLGLFTLLVACQKETSDASTTTVASAPPPGRALDPELAQAVAAASARARPGAPGEANKEGGAPPNGIFSAAAAEREAPKGGAPKITVGSDGSEPRVALGPAQPKPGSKTSGTVQVEFQSDPQQRGLPLLFGVTLEAQKAKDAKEGEPGPVHVVARVTSAAIAIPGAPPELVRDVAKLKGSKVEYDVLPDGAGSGFRFEVAKGAETADSIRALSDTLAVVTLPYPDKPVGAGAYWMATSRDEVFGLDLVSYRLVRVERVEPGKVSLTVNTKRYSASPTLDLVGLPPDTPRDMIEFQALAEGKLEVVPGSGFPGSGQQNSMLGAALGKGNQPAGTLQLRTMAKVDLGK